MNNSKKSQKIVLQNDKNLQKSQKHDVNLQKNSTLYFQVGLILCLLASYGALEMSFAGPKDYVYATPEIDEGLFVINPEIYVIEKKVEPKQKQQIKKQKPKNPDIKIVDNKTKTEKALENIVEKIPVDVKPLLKTNDSSLNIEDPIDNEPVNIMAVQKVPIFPGCEKETNNNGRRKCLSDKLTRLVQRKFNTDVASGIGVTGKQKIHVSFKINKLGEVEIIETRASHKALEKEANRVVGKIPTMQPGKNNNKPVEVSYMLPIKFNIQ